MLINQFLDQAWVWPVTFVILSTIILVIAATSVFIGWALRDGDGAAPVLGVVAAAPLVFALWAGAALATSLSMTLDIRWFLPFALTPITLGLAASFTRVGAAILKRIPTHWMVALQTYRAVGAIFLVPYMTQGVLTPGFAWPAGVGDVLTGLAAPLIAWGVLKDPERWRFAFYAWTVFGVLDLIVAPASAVMFGFGADDRQLSFAVTAIPLFLGPPFGIVIHLWTWRSFELRRRLSGGHAR